ncbi:MAG TPA: SRPBCC family protein [Sphingomonadaceae bacterium]|nr:SRPBCC family protein [Sphingomonadaceae bacterium]
MNPKFTVSGRIARPVGDVFEAVVNPNQLSHYFTTGGAQGRLEPGATVSWDFHDFPGAFPVQVVEVEKDRKIVLRWDSAAPGGGQTTVTMTFEPIGEARTLVRISEEGWPETPEGLTASYGNCEGWTGMLCAMKMWIEHGIRLRSDFYK